MSQMPDEDATIAGGALGENGRSAPDKIPTFHDLGDFSANRRLIVLSTFAFGIGTLSAFVALALLRLIGLFTNLFYFGRVSTDLVSPEGNPLGFLALFIPISGGLIVGLMARYGSERIRGHGIPEAIEAILLNGSRVQPRLAVLKPLSSAIAIGSGGPFGAEGPIIMTGGALGSMIAQFIHLTSAERKTLLVAGAAGGMSATFGSPVAAVLLAVELLLFEWKPRSLIPVAVSSIVAATLRHYIIGPAPIFPTSPHPDFIGPVAMLGCLFVGLASGILSMTLTAGVYAAEDAFHKLPIHWMWWPAIGAVAVGAGGLIFPQALGVGYSTIGQMVNGDVARSVIIGVLIVKSVIWIVSLSSGTSGGVLAPLLMIGGALGALEGMVLPHEGAGFWAILGMGAVLGGTMRSPFTGIIFMLELTHDINLMLPLLIAVMAAHAFTVLALRRSILTEKISRRGYHLSREYSVDPLEILFVREVMSTNIIVLTKGMSPAEIRDRVHADEELSQRLYPIVDRDGHLVGAVTATQLRALTANGVSMAQPMTVLDMVSEPAVTYPDEPLRIAVHRMAETGLTRFPVVTREDQPQLLGMLSLSAVLRARARNLEAERRRERLISLRVLSPFLARAAEGSQAVKQD